MHSFRFYHQHDAMQCGASLFNKKLAIPGKLKKKYLLLLFFKKKYVNSKRATAKKLKG